MQIYKNTYYFPKNNQKKWYNTAIINKVEANKNQLSTQKDPNNAPYDYHHQRNEYLEYLQLRKIERKTKVGKHYFLSRKYIFIKRKVVYLQCKLIVFMDNITKQLRFVCFYIAFFLCVGGIKAQQ